MELMNQVLFAIFTLILFGIFLSSANGTILELSGFRSFYWRYSIGFRATAFLAWALAPIVGPSALIVANFSFEASVILLALFLSSWRVIPSEKLLRFLVGYYFTVCLIYFYLLLIGDQFIQRTNVIAISSLLMMIWEAIEVLLICKRKKDFILKIIAIFLVLQLALAITSIIFINTNLNQDAKNILQANLKSSLMLWIVFGIHITIYTLINSYLYKRILISEKVANSKYDQASKERLEIQALLVERENLIANLIKSNKTAVTGALAASLAHELSQPLGSSLLNAQHLKSLIDSPNSSPKFKKDIIELIETDTKRAGEIIHSLRKIFSGDAISFEQVDLPQLVRSLIHLVTPECKSSKIKLIIQMPEKCLVEMNYVEIYQVILNLLNNAIQSLKRSEGSRAKEIQISVSEIGPKVLLSIIDNGDGISDDHEHSLFELLDPNKSSGLGVGLWLCKHIMVRHHADITYRKPIKGAGAVFSLSFPIKQLDNSKYE